MQKDNSFIKELLRQRFIFFKSPSEGLSKLSQKGKEGHARNTIRAKALKLMERTYKAADKQKLQALIDESYKSEGGKDANQASVKLLKLLYERGVKFVKAEEEALTPIKKEIENREESKLEAKLRQIAKAKAAVRKAAAKKEGEIIEKKDTLNMVNDIKRDMDDLYAFLIDDDQLSWKAKL